MNCWAELGYERVSFSRAWLHEIRKKVCVGLNICVPAVNRTSCGATARVKQLRWALGLLMNSDKLRFVIRVGAAIDVLLEVLDPTVEHFHVTEARASITNHRVLTRNVEPKAVGAGGAV